MSPEKRSLPYHFFFNKSFTSFPLLYWLDFFGYSGTDTIADNRYPNGKLNWQVGIRSGFHAATRQLNQSDGMGTICALRNGLITLSFASVQPNMAINHMTHMTWLTVFLRYIAWTLLHNHLLSERYKAIKGGTKRTDQNVAAYRIAVHKRNCTWCTDVTLQNAWLLQREATGDANLTQFEFYEDVAMDLSSCQKKIDAKLPQKLPYEIDRSAATISLFNFLYRNNKLKC